MNLNDSFAAIAHEFMQLLPTLIKATFGAASFATVTYLIRYLLFDRRKSDK